MTSQETAQKTKTQIKNETIEIIYQNLTVSFCHSKLNLREWVDKNSHVRASLYFGECKATSKALSMLENDELYGLDRMADILAIYTERLV